MKKIILLAILMIATITYASAQQITCGYKKIVVSWNPNTDEFCRSCRKNPDGSYTKIPCDVITKLGTTIYENYTSITKRWITGTLPVYFVWTCIKDDYGNTEEIEKYLGAINLMELRKYKNSSYYEDSKEIQDIEDVFRDYEFNVLPKYKCLRYWIY